MVSHPRRWFWIVVLVLLICGGAVGLVLSQDGWPLWLKVVVGIVGFILVAFTKPAVDMTSTAVTGWLEQKRKSADVQEEIKGLYTRVLDEDVTKVGIHPAIPLPKDVDPSLYGEFPAYVHRGSDDEIQRNLESFKKKGGFLLIIGDAGTGKTRAAYEGIKKVVPDWRLFRPQDVGQVEDFADEILKNSFSPTVVWLDNLDRFLQGGLRLATVARLLDQSSQPVILMGTMWPKQYDDMSHDRQTERTLEDGHSSAEHHNNDLVDILKRTTTIYLTQDWDDQSIEKARQDPRIAEALGESNEFSLPQILAASPDLWNAYDHPIDEFGNLVLCSAVAIRQCGLSTDISQEMLQHVADLKMTAAQRGRINSESWFHDALTSASTPVCGIIAPLYPVRGWEQTELDYSLSDIVFQHAISSTPYPDGEIVNKIIEDASPADCVEIAKAHRKTHKKKQDKEQTVLCKVCEQALQRATSAGIPEGWYLRGLMQDVDGDNPDLAEPLYLKGADLGDAQSMHMLGHLYHGRGEVTKGNEWFEKAIATGDTAAIACYGRNLLLHGDIDTAETILRQGAESGDSHAMHYLAHLFEIQGNRSQASPWYQKGVAGGDISAYSCYAHFLEEEPDSDAVEIENLYRQGAEAGSSQAMMGLADFLEEEGNPVEADEWYKHAIDEGEDLAPRNYALALHRRGDDENALQVLRQAADSGDTDVMPLLASLLELDNNTNEAQNWFAKAVDHGEISAYELYSNALLEKGNFTAAEHVLREAVQSGTEAVMQAKYELLELAEKLEETEDHTQADEWYRQAIEAGNPFAPTVYAWALFKRRDDNTALQILQEASLADNGYAMLLLASVLRTQGNLSDAEKWKNRAEDIFRPKAEAGDAFAMMIMGRVLEEAGGTEESMVWFSHAAEAGNSKAMIIVAEDALRHNDTATAQKWALQAQNDCPEDANEILSHIDGALKDPKKDTSANTSSLGSLLSDLQEADDELEQGETTTVFPNQLADYLGNLEEKPSEDRSL